VEVTLVPWLVSGQASRYTLFPPGSSKSHLALTIESAPLLCHDESPGSKTACMVLIFPIDHCFFMA
jgi:hypothetical protein